VIVIATNDYSGYTPLDQLSKEREDSFLGICRRRTAVKDVSAHEDTIHSVSCGYLENF
jgi:hypothetical protein